MRKVLTVNYSQTGQLSSILDSVVGPLKENKEITVDHLVIKPKVDFPFPWPFGQFFRVFPETVAMDPIELEPFETQFEKYDLIILSYQVWFLTPSLPISSFLQLPQTKQLFKDTPVVTLIGCRGMWLSAQEKMKKLLAAADANLVDNVVLSDDCGAAFSFLATPLWMMTGKKKPLSWVPAAGVSQTDIADAKRFGYAIRQRLLLNDTPITRPMFFGMKAVKINEKLIASERVGNHSFSIWSKILKKFGSQQSFGRAVGLSVYVVFLVTLILTVVPITAIIKKLIAPLTRKKIAKQKAYYAEPSGE
ncbi:dialkylrecorsinol condensing enzyme [Pseudoalteromonas sp. MMG024]|uniref:dialkylrecorsinol condensing enzyme n=1 Tax=Pseudoalteromonas sp. MMG024 TaxID=2909980 RepID=UPI001F44AC84|nr:dialkylrecorsinol condensing enzyme [Pseudoalteromonas sp. MMG024]MCF6456922.1 dialkylresorcinol condensing enzyme [Pseudoalteromonas sp. MMG024]